MNIDQLKYLADLAKTSSINTTAKRMFISQQALSMSIKRLEHELGCTLLHRSKTGVEFTEDGKHILDSALHILEHYDEMMAYLDSSQHKNNPRGKLMLGIAPAATSSFLPDLLLTMHAQYPDITLYIQEHTAEQILSLLGDGKLDFGMFGFSVEDTDYFIDESYIEFSDAFHFYPLYTDYLVCVMTKNHPLSVYPSITNETLQNVKFTQYAHNPIARIEGLCYHVSNNTEIHQQFMREEGTICCMPFQVFQAAYDKKEFIAIPVSDSKPVTCYLAYRKNSDLIDSPIYQTFIQTARSIMETTTL